MDAINADLMKTMGNAGRRMSLLANPFSVVKNEEEDDKKTDDEAIPKKKGHKPQFDMDALPYVEFIEHFKHIDEWKETLSDPSSPFMRLISTGEVFFKKKVIA